MTYKIHLERQGDEPKSIYAVSDWNEENGIIKGITREGLIRFFPIENFEQVWITESQIYLLSACFCGMEILHAFADTGVESYVLAKHGNVTRLGINPDRGLLDVWNFQGASNVVQADAIATPFKDDAFDLALIHPPCTPFTDFSGLLETIYEDYERPDSMIDDARKEVKRISQDYIIENKPKADIRNDVVLNGLCFDIPYKKERAFECSFSVSQPELFDVKEMDGSYRSEWSDSKPNVMWGKGYPDIWTGKEAMNASIPKKYIQFLMSEYLSEYLSKCP